MNIADQINALYDKFINLRYSSHATTLPFTADKDCLIIANHSAIYGDYDNNGNDMVTSISFTTTGIVKYDSGFHRYVRTIGSNAAVGGSRLVIVELKAGQTISTNIVTNRVGTSWIDTCIVELL